MKIELRRVTARTPGAQDARRRWPARESLLLRLTDREEKRGVGEASPLPDYSPDTLDDAEAALAGLEISDVEAALALALPRAVLTALAALLSARLPAARMALETAAMDLLSRRHGLSAPAWLGAEPDSSRALAQLVGPASAATLDASSDRAVAAGFAHLKLKLGTPGKLREELAAVTALRPRLGPGVSLRLDANRALSLPDLENACEALSAAQIELFEEPSAEPQALLGGVPLGLDESLQGLTETEVDALLSRTRARSVVLKPTALGGVEHCWRLAERARALGVDAIISHCFEGPFAWRAAAALALALPTSRAHGLAPHAGLQAWRLSSLPVRAGRLEMWGEPGLGLPTELEPS